MIVVVPAGNISPRDRHILTARDFQRPDRAITSAMSFGHNRCKRGGDEKSGSEPF
jgi:hypothetical protein